MIFIQDIPFTYHTLGDSAIVLFPTHQLTLSNIHPVGEAIRISNIDGIIDVVVAYENITIYFTPLKISLQKILELLSQVPLNSHPLETHQTFNIPIHFEKGLDWQAVEKETKLSQAEVIDIFLNGVYTVAMLGFIPGFMYLEGLDERLICGRKSVPRKKVPKGSVGIGGKQAGIYGLESPGGWQIIGQTDMVLFDIHKNPPTKIQAMDKVKFVK